MNEVYDIVLLWVSDLLLVGRQSVQGSEHTNFVDWLYSKVTCFLPTEEEKDWRALNSFN